MACQTNAQPSDPDSKGGNGQSLITKYIEVALADSANADKYKNGLVESYKYLGSYYYLIKRKKLTKSKSYWKKVLELVPDDKQAQQVMQD